MPRAVAAATIRHVEIDGCRVILDLNTEAYRILDEVASAMWRILTGDADRDRSLAELRARYDVDLARLQADFEAFEARCFAAQLLVPQTHAAADAGAVPRRQAPSRGAAPGVLGALHCMLATQRALARRGFRETYERYAALPARGEPAELPRALRSFGRAENVFIARRAPDDCVVRSLSLYRFLRASGIAAHHVIGVNRFPFQAHAWVEVDAVRVLDDAGRTFTPLARLDA